MQPRFYPDAGSLSHAQAPVAYTPLASLDRPATRETQQTSACDLLADRTLSTADLGRCGRFAPGIRGLCNAVPLSIMLWVAIILVCFR